MSAAWEPDRLRRERDRLDTFRAALSYDNGPTAGAWTVDRLRVAHDRLAAALLALPAHPLPADAIGATGQAAVEVADHRQRFDCLHLALGALVDQAAEVDPGGVWALLARPVRVVFTAATKDPVQTEDLPVAELVAAAGAEVAAIRRIVDGYAADLAALADALERAGGVIRELPEPDRAPLLARLPAITDPVGQARDGRWHEQLAMLRAETRGLAAVGKLREAMGRLRSLFDDARAEQLGDGVDPLPKLGLAPLLGRVDALEPAWREGNRWNVESVEGLLVELTGATGNVDEARQRLRVQCWSELTGMLEAYRQRAANEGHGETPRLLSLDRTATRHLHARPFLIRPAARAVRAYIRAVNEESG
ncbi:hypothetical protein GCM10023322_58820 [Rugosimonospora acidiphila]|uniref:Uncharacterized protein n=1 Tax=Rugosimonospora acidiphila TaxID=556531 RepID=A0ABP9SF60_9ACTN